LPASLTELDGGSIGWADEDAGQVDDAWADEGRGGAVEAAPVMECRVSTGAAVDQGRGGDG
jgi:hypothetical protein